MRLLTWKFQMGCCEVFKGNKTWKLHFPTVRFFFVINPRSKFIMHLTKTNWSRKLTFVSHLWPSGVQQPGSIASSETAVPPMLAIRRLRLIYNRLVGFLESLSRWFVLNDSTKSACLWSCSLQGILNMRTNEGGMFFHASVLLATRNGYSHTCKFIMIRCP